MAKAEVVLCGRASFLAGAICLAAALEYGPTASGAENAGLDDILGCDGEWAESPLCVERARALEARAKIEAILSALAAVNQPPWPPGDLAAASALYDEGAVLFGDEYFGDAALKFEPALAKLVAIRQWFEDHVAATVGEAQELLAAEEFPEALAGFRRVLAWKPKHDTAAKGAEHAETGQFVQRNAGEAIRLVEAGQGERARTLLAGLPDFPSTTLDEAKRVLRDYDRASQLRTHITAGHAALDRNDWAAATTAFRQALVVDPTSAAAQDGLDRATHGALESALAALRRTLDAQLADEAWPDSISTIRKIAELAPDAPEISQRLADLERLAELEARVDHALADLGRAAAKTMRADTRTIIADTADRSEVGDRIHAKGRELERKFGIWTAPVPLEIRSDNRTDIRMRPGRRLGTLRSVDLEVYPGTYTLIGRRDGFREKKVDLSVEPGSGRVVVELVCDERF